MINRGNSSLTINPLRFLSTKKINQQSSERYIFLSKAPQKTQFPVHISNIASNHVNQFLQHQSLNKTIVRQKIPNDIKSLLETLGIVKNKPIYESNDIQCIYSKIHPYVKHQHDLISVGGPAALWAAINTKLKHPSYSVSFIGAPSKHGGFKAPLSANSGWQLHCLPPAGLGQNMRHGMNGFGLLSSIYPGNWKSIDGYPEVNCLKHGFNPAVLEFGIRSFLNIFPTDHREQFGTKALLNWQLLNSINTNGRTEIALTNKQSYKLSSEHHTLAISSTDTSSFFKNHPYVKKAITYKHDGVFKLNWWMELIDKASSLNINCIPGTVTTLVVNQYSNHLNSIIMHDIQGIEREFFTSNVICNLGPLSSVITPNGIKHNPSKFTVWGNQIIMMVEGQHTTPLACNGVHITPIKFLKHKTLIIISHGAIVNEPKISNISAKRAIATMLMALTTTERHTPSFEILAITAAARGVNPRNQFETTLAHESIKILGGKGGNNLSHASATVGI